MSNHAHACCCETGCCSTMRYWIDHPFYPDFPAPVTMSVSGSADLTATTDDPSPSSCYPVSTTYTISDTPSGQYNLGGSCGVAAQTELGDHNQDMCSGSGNIYADWEMSYDWFPRKTGVGIELDFYFTWSWGWMRIKCGFTGDGTLAYKTGTYAVEGPNWPPTPPQFSFDTFNPSVASISGSGDYHRTITVEGSVSAATSWPYTNEYSIDLSVSVGWTSAYSIESCSAEAMLATPTSRRPTVTPGIVSGPVRQAKGRRRRV